MHATEFRTHATSHFFAGNYKTGKFSLINAMRGLRNSDPGAAKADIVECTTTVKKYTGTDQLAHLSLFDVAGAGTMGFPNESEFVYVPLFTNKTFFPVEKNLKF